MRRPIGCSRQDFLTLQSLDLFWLKDRSLTDLNNLPEPDQLAEEIIENLEAGLASLRSVLGALTASPPEE